MNPYEFIGSAPQGAYGKFKLYEKDSCQNHFEKPWMIFYLK